MPKLPSFSVATATLGVLLFGSSEWLNVSAVWMQLPLLVDQLPEKWNLPSILTLIVQLGCVAPLTYALCRRWVTDVVSARLVLFMMVFAIVSMILLGFLWSYTINIGGKSLSGPLYVLFFLLSCKSTGATVIFLPFMARFKSDLITPFFVGIGIGALVPSLVSLGQGSSSTTCVNVTYDNQTHLVAKHGDANFSVELFFFLMAGWQVVALLAFVYITYIRKDLRAISGVQPADKKLPELLTTSTETSSSSPLFYVLFITACLSAFQNGILPSIMSYSALPYGQICYHLSLTLGNIANPLACMLPLVVTVRSVRIVTIVALVAFASSSYLFILAFLSPHPIVISQSPTLGMILAIVASIIAMGSLAYCRALVAHILNEHSNRKVSEKRLYYCGLATQVGSFLTASVMFVLVNYTSLFVSSSGCSN